MSSLARTTQTVTYGRRLPSGRVEAICSCCACPIRVSSSCVHVVVMAVRPFDLSVLDSDDRLLAFADDVLAGADRAEGRLAQGERDRTSAQHRRLGHGDLVRRG